jgi:hypothetical protein
MEAQHDHRTDEDFRKFIVGLTTRLEEYFSRQLDIQARLKGERCPGEEKCSSSPLMPLFRRPEEPIEKVCGGCRLRETKPGMQPIDLSNAIAVGLELETLKESGATFVYPDSLNSYQWACLKGLKLGRAVYQEQDAKQRTQEAERRAQESRLRAMTGRYK